MSYPEDNIKFGILWLHSIDYTSPLWSLSSKLTFYVLISHSKIYPFPHADIIILSLNSVQLQSKTASGCGNSLITFIITIGPGSFGFIYVYYMGGGISKIIKLPFPTIPKLAADVKARRSPTKGLNFTEIPEYCDLNTAEYDLYEFAKGFIITSICTNFI